jgi:hypothetical protein
MIKRLKLAILRGRELDTLPRFGPKCRDRKTLFARGHQLHRPPESAGCDCNNCGSLGQCSLGTEGSPDIAADDPDLAGLDAKLGGEPVLDAIDILARLMDRQLRAIPDALRGEQFDRVVMLRRSRIAGGDFDGSGFISGREIPNLGIVVFLVLFSQLLFNRSLRIEGAGRWLLFVFNADLGGRVLGDFQRMARKATMTSRSRTSKGNWGGSSRRPKAISPNRRGRSRWTRSVCAASSKESSLPARAALALSGSTTNAVKR